MKLAAIHLVGGFNVFDQCVEKRQVLPAQSFALGRDRCDHCPTQAQSFIVPVQAETRIDHSPVLGSRGEGQQDGADIILAYSHGTQHIILDQPIQAVRRPFLEFFCGYLLRGLNY
ncbi:MAG: hypothetical protein ACI8X5_002368 [Planctomycetota bacterium]